MSLSRLFGLNAVIRESVTVIMLFDTKAGVFDAVEWRRRWCLAIVGRKTNPWRN
jgi:hypothetical protein